MHQLSFFSAESEPPEPADLAGLLAGPGQCVLSGDPLTGGTARISVVVEDLWRAEAIAELMAQCALPARRIGTEISRSEEGRPLVRTEPAQELAPLGHSWVKGAAKTVPAGWTPSSRAQRAWALAAGWGEDGHYLLGLDPHAPETHEPLAGALSRVGIAAAMIGPRGGGPALRITGRRRLSRLAENVGSPPAGAPTAGAWPVG